MRRANGAHPAYFDGTLVRNLETKYPYRTVYLINSLKYYTMQGLMRLISIGQLPFINKWAMSLQYLGVRGRFVRRGFLSSSPYCRKGRVLRSYEKE